MVDERGRHLLAPLLRAWSETPMAVVDRHLDIVDRTSSFDALFGLGGNVLHALLTRKAFATCDSRFDGLTRQLSRILMDRADRDLEDERFHDIYASLRRDAPRFDRWSGAQEDAVFEPCRVGLPVRLTVVEFAVYLLQPVADLDVEVLAFVPVDAEAAERLARLFDEVHPGPEIPSWE
jgi:hypothetical protein